jgi:hypothetical protein
MVCGVKIICEHHEYPLVKLSSGYLVRCDSNQWLPHAIQAGHIRERDVCVSILHEINKLLEE